jgi:H+-transporting ATPase
MPGFDEAHVLALAALASSDGGQDPVDGAIRSAAGGKPVSDAPKMIKFVSFDPGTKMSEATVQDPGGVAQRVSERRFRGRRWPRAAFADRGSHIEGA